MQLTGCHFLQETCATCFWSSLMFILVINQLDAQNLFYSKFISCLYIFRAPCAHRQEVKIVLYSLWYHHTEKSEWSKITKIYKYEHIVVKFMCEFFGCDYCVLLTINMLWHVEVMFIQLLNLLERYYVYLHLCLRVEARNKLILKQILCINLVNYEDK